MPPKTYTKPKKKKKQKPFKMNPTSCFRKGKRDKQGEYFNTLLRFFEGYKKHMDKAKLINTSVKKLQPTMGFQSNVERILPEKAFNAG